MEYVLLYKLGLAINVVVKTGYAVVGMYVVGTGYRYYKDYRYFEEQEKMEGR